MRYPRIYARATYFPVYKKRNDKKTTNHLCTLTLFINWQNGYNSKQNYISFSIGTLRFAKLKLKEKNEEEVK